MDLGYVRVSSVDQNEGRQLDRLKNEDVDKIVIEKASGGSRMRPKLKECLEWLDSDDCLVVCSIDRLARNLSDLTNIVNELSDKGVSVRFLKENLKFGAGGNSDPINKMLFQVLGSFAEFEKSLIRERQKEGIARAKKDGKYKGRKKCLSANDITEVRKLVADGWSKVKVAEKYDVSRQTIYNVL